MTFKQKVHASYQQLLAGKIAYLQKTLADLTESAKNETKSTAGDKHETALAMLQIEQENNSKQLRDTLTQKDAFERIDIHLSSDSIIKGSLVITNRGYFFMLVSLGKLVVGDVTIIAISPESPLGKQLMGKQKGNTAEVNGMKYSIENVA